jgi:hypothetical protein
LLGSEAKGRRREEKEKDAESVYIYERLVTGIVLNLSVAN